MEQTERIDQSAEAMHGALIAPPSVDEPSMTVSLQTGKGGCSCGSTASSNGNTAEVPYSYVYALGRIETRFPRSAVEKELAQALGRTDAAGLTDRQAIQRVLSERTNRYLARQLCWVLTIEGLETYILNPRDPADYELLIEAIRAEPSSLDVDLVVGVRGPIAPPEICNGLLLPIVVFDQIYSFDRDALIKAIPRPATVPAKQERQFRTAAGELFDRIIQITDNAGATDEHRALNYLSVRYPSIYSLASEAFGRNFSLSSVDVRPSRLSGLRNVVDVVFGFTNRETDVNEKYFVRVDVTEEFPFLVTRMAPYFDR